jgi:hypothetical protein
MKKKFCEAKNKVFSRNSGVVGGLDESSAGVKKAEKILAGGGYLCECYYVNSLA